MNIKIIEKASVRESIFLNKKKTSSTIKQSASCATFRGSSFFYINKNKKVDKKEIESPRGQV